MIQEHTTRAEHIRQDDVLFNYIDYIVHQDTDADHNTLIDDIDNYMSQVETPQLETLF